MLRVIFFCLLASPAFLAHPAAADGGFVPVQDKAAFLDRMKGRALHLPLYGVRLSVLSDGRISGEALGSEVTGTWAWRDGFFCRDMVWRGRAIPHNCQLVEAQGQQLRFTSDRGAGRSAKFRLVPGGMGKLAKAGQD